MMFVAAGLLSSLLDLPRCLFLIISPHLVLNAFLPMVHSEELASPDWMPSSCLSFGTSVGILYFCPHLHVLNRAVLFNLAQFHLRIREFASLSGIGLSGLYMALCGFDRPCQSS